MRRIFYISIILVAIAAPFSGCRDKETNKNEGANGKVIKEGLTVSRLAFAKINKSGNIEGFPIEDIEPTFRTMLEYMSDRGELVLLCLHEPEGKFIPEHLPQYMDLQDPNKTLHSPILYRTDRQRSWQKIGSSIEMTAFPSTSMYILYVAGGPKPFVSWKLSTSFSVCEENNRNVVTRYPITPDALKN